MIDIIIILVVVLCVVGSIVYVRSRKRAGKSSCGGGCNSCPSSCSTIEEKQSFH